MVGLYLRRETVVLEKAMADLCLGRETMVLEKEAMVGGYLMADYVQGVVVIVLSSQ